MNARLFAILLLLVAGQAFAAAAASSPSARGPSVDVSATPTIVKYTEGGVTIHSFISPEVSECVTSHVIEMAHHVVVVDTQMLRPYAKQLRAYVDGLGKPVAYVIVSHGHPDHYFGLEYFADLPTYGTEETIKRMHLRSQGHLAGHKEREGDLVLDEVVYPTHVLKPGTLEVDGVKLEVEEVEGGEDLKQLVIRIPQAKTMVLQDLVTGNYHAFTGTLMLDSWIALLGRLKAIAEQQGYVHLLPGHGVPGGISLFAETQQYLAKAKEVFASAKTQQDYVRGMRAAFPGRGGHYILEVSAIIWDRDR